MLGRKNSLRRNLLALAIASPWLFALIVRALALDFTWPLIPIVALSPQTLGWSLLPLAVALLLRARWTALALFVAMVWVGLLIVPRTAPNDQPPAQGRTVRLFTANLKIGSASMPALAKLIHEDRPDIIGLQEVTPANMRELRKLGVMSSRPYTAGHPDTGSVGYAAISRWPLTTIPDTDLASGAWPQMRVSGLPLLFRNVHPAPPLKPTPSKHWQADLRSIPAARVGGSASVISGDFNATLDHRDFRAVLGRGYRDAGDETGNGLKWTWDVSDNGKLVIDHVLVSGGIAVSDYAVHDLTGSDHNAVTVTLRLP